MLVTTARTAKAEWRRRRAAAVRAVLSPPPKLTISEWADRYRVLSREASAEPGKWRTDRAPYLRGIMDALSDPVIETVVVISSAQIGKTEVVNNTVGFFVDQDPSPILVMQPSLEVAKAWSADRLAPMLRDTPRLRNKVKDPRSRDSGNTILGKKFPGGHITMVGANSAASLASRPIRVVLCDEIDRYPASAGTEGDPIGLARKRTATFWNRRIGLFTTPTVKGFSRGEKAWESCDQRRYHVPCPHCDHYQVLVWGGVHWEQGKPETAVYVCESCGGTIEEPDKGAMLARGRWIAEAPGRRTAGFHLNALYSPWARWEELVREWLEAQGRPDLLKVFVNTVLGEWWDEAGEQVDAHELYQRLEAYGRSPDGDTRPDLPDVPSGAGVLTCAVDVQGDRLEAAVWGWGAGEESWLVATELFPGDPGTTAPWAALDHFLKRSFTHEDGATLGLSATFVDSGGHHTKEVYAFCRERVRRKVFASKGSSLENPPLLSRPTRVDSARVTLFMVGGSTAKDTIASRFKIEQHGPGFIHLPDWVDAAYLEQLTSEKKVTRYLKGRPHRVWILPNGRRNEGLDLYVYNMGALAMLGPLVTRDLGSIVKRVQAAGAARKAPTGPVDEVRKAARRVIKGRRKGWVQGWR